MRVFAVVLVGAMQQIAVKKESVARVHFAVNELVTFDGGFDALHVGAYLIARFSVIDASDFVGAFQHLQTAVRLRRTIDGNQTTAMSGYKQPKSYQ